MGRDGDGMAAPAPRFRHPHQVSGAGHLELVSCVAVLHRAYSGGSRAPFMTGRGVLLWHRDCVEAPSAGVRPAARGPASKEMLAAFSVERNLVCIDGFGGSHFAALRLSQFWALLTSQQP